VRSIQRNIVDSTINFTPTIGSFLRIFFELNVTDQPERLIRSASSKSFNHHIGIALLENQLTTSSMPANGKIY
jgi:DNA-dependent protein kinase catalytic subunit